MSKYCRCNNKYHKPELHDRLCHGDGPDDAEVIFVGIAPGMEEADSGRYFVGPSGRQLRRDIVEAGIPTTKCRFENVAQYWPREHQLNNLTNEQRQSGRSALVDVIRRTRPRVVVPLGDDALKELTGENRITKWRGSKIRLGEDYRPSEQECDPLVVPTVHPSAVLRAWDYRVLFMHDLRRVARFLQGQDINQKERRFIVRGDEDYDEACDRILYACAQGKVIAADIEVYKGELACISFASDPQWGVAVHADDRDVWQEILATDAPKVWHNSMYDLTFLKARCSVVPNGYQHDTQLMWHALYPELACSKYVGKSLALLASIFTNENFYKDSLTSWRKVADWDAFYRYGARDAAVTIEVFEALDELMDRNDPRLENVYDFMIQLVRPYSDASIRGVKIDTRTKGHRAGGSKNRINSLTTKLQELGGGESFNPNSWQQVLKVLNGMGLELPNTQVTTLTRAKMDTEKGSDVHTFLETLLDYRHEAKAYGTYYTFQHDRDGRLRPSWNVGGTETGRLSSSGSIIFAGKVNFQTLPYAARKFVVPDGGYRLVYADLAKAEAQVVAYLSGCERLITAFEKSKEDPKKYDVYRVVAGWMYGKDPEDITKDERYLAKRCVLGLLYGMGVKTWRLQTNTDKGYDYISRAKTQELFDLFFGRFPEIKDYHSWCTDQLNRHRELWTPFGRRRTFRKRNGRWDHHTLREAYDYIPQTIPPDIINHGVLQLESCQPEIQTIGQIHDAWFGQVKDDDDLADGIGYIKACLTCPIELMDIRGRERELIIPVDVETGYNWKPADDDNPKGLETWT